MLGFAIFQLANYNIIMTATGHALVAALIAAKFHNPYIALPLSLASHFACDLIPHWDAGTHRRSKTRKQLFLEAGVDVAISLGASYLVYHNFLHETNYVLLYASVFLSQLPDWLMAPYVIFNGRGKLLAWSKWMYKLQHVLQSRLDLPWGLVTQIVTPIILYIILFRIF